MAGRAGVLSAYYFHSLPPTLHPLHSLLIVIHSEGQLLRKRNMLLVSTPQCICTESDIIWSAQAVGVLSSAYTSGWLVGWAGARPTLGVMAIFPLLMCGTAFLIKERRRSPHSADLEGVRVPPEVVQEGEESEELLGEPWRKEEGELTLQKLNDSLSAIWCLRDAKKWKG